MRASVGARPGPQMFLSRLLYTWHRILEDSRRHESDASPTNAFSVLGVGNLTTTNHARSLARTAEGARCLARTGNASDLGPKYGSSAVSGRGRQKFVKISTRNLYANLCQSAGVVFWRTNHWSLHTQCSIGENIILLTHSELCKDSVNIMQDHRRRHRAESQGGKRCFSSALRRV